MDVGLSEPLELVMNREAWRAAIHVATKSQTRLSEWTETQISCYKYVKITKVHFAKKKKKNKIRYDDSMALNKVCQKSTNL